MNKLLKLLSILILGGFFFSCSSDKEIKPEEENNDPNLELTIFLNGRLLSIAEDGEEIYREYDSMEYAEGLVFAIHRQEDGLFIKSEALWGDNLKKIVDKDKAVLKQYLPVGNYYVSLISLTEGETLPAKAADLLAKRYEDAVCVINPKEDMYYQTMTVSVKDDGAAKEVARLKKMTSAYVYMFGDMQQIPDDAAIQIRVSLKNLPSSFYLKDMQTLTKKEEAELGITRFSDEVLMDKKPTSRVMAKYFQLNNENLEDKGDERGTLNIVVSIESPGEGGAKSKIVNEVFPTTESDFYGLTSEIFSTKAKEILAK